MKRIYVCSILLIIGTAVNSPAAQSVTPNPVAQESEWVEFRSADGNSYAAKESMRMCGLYKPNTGDNYHETLVYKGEKNDSGCQVFIEAKDFENKFENCFVIGFMYSGGNPSSSFPYGCQFEVIRRNDQTANKYVFKIYGMDCYFRCKLQNRQ